MPRFVAATALLVVACAGFAQGTWIPKDGECPWYDRMDRYVIGDLPEKYIGDKPIPQQSCAEPRKLILPAAGATQVIIAVSATQSAQFAEKLGLEPTGDSLQLMNKAGTKALLQYDIFLYKNPPEVTEFEGAKAGVMLLSWDGDSEPTEAPPNTYTPAERARPWHDRTSGAMQWLMVDVPAGIKHGKHVPQQSCEAKTIILPRDGLDAVTIGVRDNDIPKITALLKGKIAATSADFCIQAPSGSRKLPYSILIYNQPARETLFEGFGAGLVLLALRDMSAEIAAGSKPAKTPREANSGVLETEQEFAAQEWPFEPGERTVKMYVEEPPDGINENTGLMLCLHNWGGIYNQDTYVEWCKHFAARYNVVAVSVNYLQSGNTEPRVLGEKPYDHGYLQAMDCLRALYHVQRQLKDAGVTLNPRRCYSMGGSGGGNVTQMVNKLAPHSFACVVDICGMPGLTDGIAYGTGEYGSHLNAGYSKDPESPAYLTKDMQQIRDPGRPEHLKLQYEANPTNKVIICHGLDDRSCPAVHKISIFRDMVDAGFHPDGHFFTPWHVDGIAVKSTEHPVGDRQKVVEKFADVYMLEDGKFALQVPGPTDFERGEEVVFPTDNGRYIVDFSGAPTVRFEEE